MPRGAGPGVLEQAGGQHRNHARDERADNVALVLGLQVVLAVEVPQPKQLKVFVFG